MGYDSFDLRIGVEGEADFKAALRDINQSFKVLGKEIDAQKDKISTFKAALDNPAESFCESDRKTQNWQIQLNKAQAEFNGMECELAESTYETGKLGDELKETSDEAEKSGGKFEKLGGVLKGIGAAMGAVALAAGATAIKLGTEVVQQFGELEQNLVGSEAVFPDYADHVHGETEIVPSLPLLSQYF